MKQTRWPWYTPSAWVSALLFEIALRAPNDTDMIVAAAFGVVEVCGLKRASKPLFIALNNFVRAKLSRSKHDN